MNLYSLRIMSVKEMVVVGVFTLGVGLIAWGIIKVVMGVRVSPEEEHDGLDIGEHGMEADPDFQGVAGRSESVAVA